MLNDNDGVCDVGDRDAPGGTQYAEAMAESSEKHRPVTDPPDTDEPEESVFTAIDRHSAAKIAWRRIPLLVKRSFVLANRADHAVFRYVVIIGLLTSIAGGLQVVFVGFILRQLIEAGAKDPLSGQWVPVAGMLIASSFMQVLSSSLTEKNEVLAEAINRETTGEILDAVGAADLEAFESPSFFARIQRAQMFQHYPSMMVNGINQLIPSLFRILALTVALARIHLLLVPFVLVAFVPIMIATESLSNTRYAFMIGNSLLERKRSYLLSVLMMRESAKEVLAFSLAPFFRQRFNELTEQSLVERRVAARKRIRTQRITGALYLVNNFLCFAVLWLLYRHGSVSLAGAGAGFYALRGISTSFDRARFSTYQLHESSMFLDDYDAFAEMAKTFRAGHPTGAAPASFDHLRADNVSFAYPQSSRIALRNVSLVISRGEIVALVGENGSGKTTLAKVLAGLYRPTGGTIRWDAIDIATVDPDQLRRGVSVIFQDFIRYFLTAAENIGVGNVANLHDRAGIEAAACQAGATEFIERLPHGFDESLERHLEGGSDLSVGQWQRIALARAFFRGAPFVILDEPTSALDARAEHDLFEKIRRLLAGRTVLLISHRFSTVRTADRIIVLHEGEIVEEGTHSTLMAANGRYAEMFTLQAKAFAD